MASLIFVTCGDDATTAPKGSSTPSQPVAGLTHDFGTIPHGQSRSHTFTLQPPGGAAGLTPVGYNSTCSCGSARFQTRSSDGKLRELTGLPFDEQRVREGEQLLLTVTVNTALKEAADLPTTTTSATAMVQDIEAQTPRISIGIVFHFAIDAPVAVLPTAHVDFGALARSQPYSQTIELRPDNGVEVAFGAVTTTDPRLTAEQREADGKTLLDMRFAPGEAAQLGPVLMAVQVQTDINDGYLLEIPVSGEVIPDIVVEPYPRIGFGRMDLSTSAERYVQVYDHDLRRDPGFIVQSVSDVDGRSLADHFECRLEGLKGRPRGTRVHLRYLGTIQGKGFRGVLTLAKPGGGPSVAIDFVGFNLPK